jgi:4-hydroxybenzoate polyprenyltransferase
MSSLKLLYKLTRLRQCFIAAISTWLITLLNDGDSWFTSENIFPALCLFFSCLGANLFHYGMKWRIYQEKYWDPVIIRRPHLLKIFGLSSFVVAGVIATIWIDSTTCFIFLGLFFLVILFYPITLDRQWPWKNLSIAFCCLSPVVIGYTASNPGENLLAWNIACVVFFVYLASEIIKDIDDQPVDRGRRITMVMVIGEPRAVRIAFNLILVAIGVVINILIHSSLTSISNIFYLLVIISLVYYGGRLVVSPKTMVPRYQLLDISILCLMLAVFTTRILS